MLLVSLIVFLRCNHTLDFPHLWFRKEYLTTTSGIREINHNCCQQRLIELPCEFITKIIIILANLFRPIMRHLQCSTVFWRTKRKYYDAKKQSDNKLKITKRWFKEDDGRQTTTFGKKCPSWNPFFNSCSNIILDKVKGIKSMQMFHIPYNKSESNLR